MAAAQAAKDKGNAAFKAGNFELAISHYTDALQIDPSQAAFPLNRAQAYIKLGRWAEAEKDAARAIRLEPASTKAYYRRGLARRARGDVAGARKDLEEAKALGAGADVDAELAKLAPASASASNSTSASPGAAKSSAASSASAHRPAANGMAPQAGRGLNGTAKPPPAQSAASSAATETPSAATSASSARLRAALSGSSSLKASTSTSTSTSSSGSSTRGAGNDLMREVSTTRRTDAPASKPAPAPAPAPASASGKEHVSTSREESKPASFSEAKAKREQRLGSRGPSSSLRSSPAPPSAIEGTSPKPSRAAGGSSTATELREDEETKAVRRIPVPTSALALETAFASVARTPHARLELLKRVEPASVPALFGASLTAETLSPMLEALATAQSAEDKAHAASFAKHLRLTRRFDFVSAFLDDREQAALAKLSEMGG